MVVIFWKYVIHVYPKRDTNSFFILSDLSLMAHNEDIFRDKFRRLFGQDALSGKERWPNGANRNDVTISIDETIRLKDKQILIEIDSGNAAKLLIGQYVLLSIFCETDRSRNLFLIIHYYEEYNVERTKKNLEFIAKSVLGEKALPFLALNEKEFWQVCRTVTNLEALWNKLQAKRSTS